MACLISICSNSFSLIVGILHSGGVVSDLSVASSDSTSGYASLSPKENDVNDI